MTVCVLYDWGWEDGKNVAPVVIIWREIQIVQTIIYFIFVSRKRQVSPRPMHARGDVYVDLHGGVLLLCPWLQRHIL